MNRRHWSALLYALIFIAALAVNGAVAGPAYADETITSAGPLSSILTTSDLNCAVGEVGDQAGEWYGNTACGTFLALPHAVYGPASIPAGDAYTPWTEKSQTAVTGTGTQPDPLTVTTDVAAGSTKVLVDQTDSYVIGQQSYRTDMTVINNSTASKSMVLYRAGDCFFSDSDTGFGQIGNGTSPDCVAPSYADPSVPGPRIESLIPITSGSSYQVGYYHDVWDHISTGAPFANSCQCDPGQGSYDNGMGLSWSLTLAPGAQTTVSLTTYFSPPPLVTSVTADSQAVVPGGPDGFSVSVTNSNALNVTADSITDQLPDGFSYVPGSTSGDITADPSISGQTLTWNGPFGIPAGGAVSLHFGVIASGDSETVFDTATATVSDPPDQTVAPASAEVDVAPVSVTDVSPGALATGKTESVTLSGTTFDPAGHVKVSGTGVTVSNLTVFSPTQASVTFTAGKAATTGPRDVTFTDSHGNSGTCTGCLTIDPHPVITALSPPALGQNATSQPLVITGTGFQPAAAVFIPGVSIEQQTWVSSTEIDLVVTVPATATVGKATLTLDNQDGATATKALTIDPKPKLTTASPAVPQGSVTLVTVTGNHFVTGLTISTTAKGVSFGAVQGVTATSFQVEVTASATAKTGKVNIVVINPDHGQATGKILTISP